MEFSSLLHFTQINAQEKMCTWIMPGVSKL